MMASQDPHIDPLGEALHIPYGPDVHCSCLLEAGKDEHLPNSSFPPNPEGQMMVSLADCSRKLLLLY